MTVTLTQSIEAAFPDRPAHDGTGLTVGMSQGNGGAYLDCALPAALPTLHCRFMLNPATAMGGSVVLLAAFDSAGAEILNLAHDTDECTITVTLATGETLTAELDIGLAWHCIELMLSSDTGDATLWINGIERDSASGTFTTLITHALWLGGIAKDTDTEGDVYLDEWVIASSYIGPVIVAPHSDHGDDPTRWLVIYNRSSDDSVTWANTYRSARNIPFANMLGLDLSLDETISSTAFSALNTAINDYLALNKLDGQVMGILLGHGVPGYATFGASHESVPALLHWNADTPYSVSNPLGVNDAPTRPTMANLQGRRLTARIDGPDVVDSLALIVNATLLMTGGLGDGSRATIWLDPYTAASGALDGYADAMVEWANSVPRMRTRLPLMLSATEQPIDEVNFDAIDNDGFFWGWRQEQPPAGFFAEPAGDRVFCFQLEHASGSAPSMRSTVAGNWMEHALAAGYVAAAGASRGYSASSIPHVRPFFDALRQGWTLAEAWFVACPWLRDGLFLVGDPLMTVAMERAGWDVFGPLSRLQQLDADNPALALRDDDRTAALPASLQPAEGATAMYVLRHVDEQGRSEAGVTLVQAQRDEQHALPVNVSPVWPTFANWPVRIADGEVRLTLHFDRPVRQCNLQALALEAQIAGESPQVVTTIVGDDAARFIMHALPVPTQQTVYRWVFTAQSGVESHTPWSAPVQSAHEAGPVLQLL